jgi:hypothetical protein
MGALIATGSGTPNAANYPRVSSKSKFGQKTARICGTAMLNKLKQIRMQDCESARDLQVRMP